MGISELLRGTHSAPAAPEFSDVPTPDSAVTEEEDALTPDPQPAHRAASSGRKTRPERPKGKLPTTVSAKKKAESQVRDNLVMFLGLGSLMGSRVDPHCFGALMQQQNAIVDALVPIIMRNANLLRWFAGSDARYLEYLALAQALAPVAMTVFRHHIVKQPHDEGGADIGRPYDVSQFQAPVFA